MGGTGLYHRALVDDLDIPGRFPEVRAELEAEPDTAVLHRRLARQDPVGAARMDPNNRRRVLRALEVTIGTGRPFSAAGPGLDRFSGAGIAQIGLAVDPTVLAGRIDQRFAAMLDAGLRGEVAALDERIRAAGHRWSRTAGQALGYRELLVHLGGDATLEEASEQTVVRTRQFARRQRAWFGRDPRITWIDATGDPRTTGDRGVPCRRPGVGTAWTVTGARVQAG